MRNGPRWTNHSICPQRHQNVTTLSRHGRKARGMRGAADPDPTAPDATGWNPKIKHFAGQLKLTPAETPKGPVYEVSGALDLLNCENDVVPLVARDGIEPPTRGFSVRCSTS